MGEALDQARDFGLQDAKALLLRHGPSVLGAGDPFAGAARHAPPAGRDLRVLGVVSEIVKQHTHRGLTPRLSFFRDQKGHECDVVIEQGDRLVAVEIKSGQIVAPDVFAALSRVSDDLRAAPGGRVAVLPRVIYAGTDSHARTAARQLSWRDIDSVEWTGAHTPKRPRPQAR